VLDYFNLIVTSRRHLERKTKEEFFEVLKSFGDTQIEVDITPISGIIVGITSLDPFLVIAKCKELVISEPWQFRHILRILPIEIVVASDANDIRNAAIKIAKQKLDADDRFKVSVEKRHTNLSSCEIIERIAELIDNKVSLQNPTWIISVQVLGKSTGVSVLKPTQIFSSVLEKRKMLLV
jgi:tRNA acetyltransferase TAN1